jgi:hypothetical protein
MRNNLNKEEAIARIREKLAEPRSEKLLRKIPETFAEHVYARLNRPRHAKYQDEVGDYGDRFRIGLKHFDFHLQGFDTIGLSAVDGEKANYLAVDIDEDFERRLPIFADVLRARGWDKASFAVNGSGPGRGKVVVTLQERLPQRQAIHLVQSLTAEASADPRFGEFKAKDLTLFPQGGDGGHCRLFGRNLRRVRTRTLGESPLDLDGSLTDLCYLKPADIAADLPGKAMRRLSLSFWAEGFIKSPYVGGTPDLFKAQCRLAYEAVPLYGEEAEQFLVDAFREVERQSPSLSMSARRGLLRPDIAKRLVKYVTSTRPASSEDGHYISRVSIWCPKENVEACKPAARVYHALSEYVVEWALDANCFGMSLDRVADLSGYSGKTKGKEALLKAVAAGLIVILDTGVPYQDGTIGLCGLYALVGHDSTPAEARAAGQLTRMYAERNRERIARGLPPLPMPEIELPAAA